MELVLRGFGGGIAVRLGFRVGVFDSVTQGGERGLEGLRLR